MLFELGTLTPPAHRVSFSGDAEAIAVMPDGRGAYIVDGRARMVRRITLEVA